MKKIIIILITSMIFINVKAAMLNDYETSKYGIENYIERFDKYTTYLLFDDAKYSYENGILSVNEDFSKGGYINLDEYNISKINGTTYLFNGLKYWTMTEDGNNVNAITSFNGELKPKTDSYGSRITEFVKRNTGVRGDGSYSNPWEFYEMSSTLVESTWNTNNIFGYTLEKSKVESIKVLNRIDIPENAIAVWDASKEHNEGVMAWITDINNNNLYELSIASTGRVIAPEDCSYIFANYTNLKELDMSGLDTSNTRNMFRMFYNLSSIESLNTRWIDSSHVTVFYDMFSGCSSLKTLNLSTLDTSKAITMQGMFYNCSNLEYLDVSMLDTSNVTNMIGVFDECRKLPEIDISNFNTDKVTTAAGMFKNCNAVEHINFGNATFKNASDLSIMFYNCYELKDLDLSKFNTANATNTAFMFSNNHRLKTIYVSDLWKMDGITNSTDMFASTVSIVGGNGTTYNSSKTNVEYARIDTSSAPGYLTRKTN